MKARMHYASSYMALQLIISDFDQGSYVSTIDIIHGTGLETNHVC